jgi:hypothetical protein
MNINRNVLSALVLASAAVCCLGTGACGKKAVSPPLAEGFRLDDPKKAALPVLTIEDVSYTNADFARFANLTIGESEVALTAEAAGRLFDDFIDRKLIICRAASEGIGLSGEEKIKSLDAFRLNRGGANAPAAEADPEDFLEGVLVEKYLTLQVKGIVVAEDEVASYYDAHKNEFLQPERLQVSQILLSAEGKASAVMEKLRSAGEEEFRQVARTESEGPEAANGGLMGVFSLGQLPLELEKVIFALEEGRLSRVVQSPYGYHIFRLDRKFEPRLMPPDEAAPLIEAKLIEQRNQTAIDAHIVFLKETMLWKVTAENLPFVYLRNR